MKRKMIAINACNLHVGGGVQAATSFIDELTRIEVQDLDISVLASSEVDKNLRSIGADTTRLHTYEVTDVYGVMAASPVFSRRFKKFDLTFTLFGPNYMGAQSGLHLVGFAQAWIIYPENEAYRRLSVAGKLLTRAKFFVRRRMFKRADRIVVELEHVKQALVAAGLADVAKVDVVHNCLSATYTQPKKWLPLDVDCSSERFKIGFVGRDYSHKNTAVLPSVKAHLKRNFGLEVDLYVTFDKKEWARKGSEFRESIRNVGSLTVAQCPTFYMGMDAVIFPSLLECFSATPLEAMAMERPLFASDRSFVRDVCGDFAYYFEPTDPESIANAIGTYVRDVAGRDRRRLERAREHAFQFSTPKRRAEQYLGAIRRTLAAVADVA